LTSVDLKEISVVTFPMNDQARIDPRSVKAAAVSPSSPRQLEELLRQAGLSRREAKAVTAAGWRGLQPGAQFEEAARLLQRYTAQLEQGDSYGRRGN
jgi:hypothetical protein